MELYLVKRLPKSSINKLTRSIWCRDVYLLGMKKQRQIIPEYNLPPLARPHRDSYYLLLLATHGRFNLNLDFKEATFWAPALLLMVSGQVHHLINMTNQ